MQYIDNSFMLFDFDEQRGAYDRELRKLKRNVYNQYLIEARRGDGISEEKISRVFDRCFTSFIERLTKRVLPRQPRVSLIELAKSRADILRQLITNASSNPITNQPSISKRKATEDPLEEGAEEMSDRDFHAKPVNNVWYTEWKQNLKKQKKLREEIKEVKDELEEHRINAQLESSEGSDVLEILEEGESISRRPERKKRKRKFDPTNPQHLQRRVESQRKYIRQRKLELRELKSEVTKYEDKLDLSSLKDGEWLPVGNEENNQEMDLRSSDMDWYSTGEGVIVTDASIDNYLEQTKVASRNSEIDRWVRVFRLKIDANLLLEAYEIFQKIPPSLQKDFCRRFGIELQNNTATVDCRGCTRMSGWEKLLICFTISDASKITINTDSDEVKKYLASILNTNFRREWLVVVPRIQQIWVFKRHRAEVGGFSQ